MYQLCKDIAGISSRCVKKGNSFIPFVADNTDYAEFKRAVMAGAELQDAEGNPMSAAAVAEFIGSLP